MDDECRIEGQHEVDVLADALAGMNGEDHPALADDVRHLLDVAVVHVGYAGYAYPVRRFEYGVYLLRIEFGGDGPSQDDGIG